MCACMLNARLISNVHLLLSSNLISSHLKHSNMTHTLQTMAFVCGVGERKGECDWKSEEDREVEMSEASQPPKQITILWEKAPTLPNIQLKFALRYDLAHTAYMCLYMNMCKCIRWNYVCIWLYRCANGERRVWAIHTTQKHSTAIRRLSEKHTARVRERKRERANDSQLNRVKCIRNGGWSVIH